MMHTVESVEPKIIEIVEELTEDWDVDLDGGVGPATTMIGDIGFASIDFIQLVVAIEGAYKQKLGFQDLLDDIKSFFHMGDKEEMAANKKKRDLRRQQIAEDQKNRKKDREAKKEQDKLDEAQREAERNDRKDQADKDRKETEAAKLAKAAEMKDSDLGLGIVRLFRRGIGPHHFLAPVIAVPGPREHAARHRREQGGQNGGEETAGHEHHTLLAKWCNGWSTP